MVDYRNKVKDFFDSLYIPDSKTEGVSEAKALKKFEKFLASNLEEFAEEVKFGSTILHRFNAKHVKKFREEFNEQLVHYPNLKKHYPNLVNVIKILTLSEDTQALINATAKKLQSIGSTIKGKYILSKTEEQIYELVETIVNNSATATLREVDKEALIKQMVEQIISDENTISMLKKFNQYPLTTKVGELFYKSLAARIVFGIAIAAFVGIGIFALTPMNIGSLMAYIYKDNNLGLRKILIEPLIAIKSSFAYIFPSLFNTSYIMYGFSVYSNIPYQQFSMTVNYANPIFKATNLLKGGFAIGSLIASTLGQYAYSSVKKTNERDEFIANLIQHVENAASKAPSFRTVSESKKDDFTQDEKVAKSIAKIMKQLISKHGISLPRHSEINNYAVIDRNFIKNFAKKVLSTANYKNMNKDALVLLDAIRFAVLENKMSLKNDPELIQVITKSLEVIMPSTKINYPDLKPHIGNLLDNLKELVGGKRSQHYRDLENLSLAYGITSFLKQAK
ncbi:MAG: hypothetical protein J0H68_07870 [Sphingobacteriia bacterium]|nr:hypothetical protein [Sphingobacteriia bacterium]